MPKLKLGPTEDVMPKLKLGPTEDVMPKLELGPTREALMLQAWLVRTFAVIVAIVLGGSGQTAAQNRDAAGTHGACGSTRHA